MDAPAPHGIEVQPKSTDEQQKFIDNRFISRDNRLSFTFKEGWICREVVYGMRVDCYPEERRVEEYDAGLDEKIVYYPNIVIEIADCIASTTDLRETDPDIKISRYFRGYGSCRVLVTVEDPDIDTEEKLDGIIMN